VGAWEGLGEMYVSKSDAVKEGDEVGNCVSALNKPRRLISGRILDGEAVEVFKCLGEGRSSWRERRSTRVGLLGRLLLRGPNCGILCPFDVLFFVAV